MANFLYEKHFLISRIVLKIIKIIKKSKKLFYIWKISPSRIVFEQQLKIFKFVYLLSPPSFIKSKIFLSEASHLLDLRDNILFISRYRFRNFEIFNVLRLLVPLVSNPEKDIDDIFFSRILVFPPTPHGYQTGKNHKPDPPFLRG